MNNMHTKVYTYPYIKRTNICDSWIGNEGSFAFISPINPIKQVISNSSDTFISSGDCRMYVYVCFCMYIYIYAYKRSICHYFHKNSSIYKSIYTYKSITK